MICPKCGRAASRKKSKKSGDMLYIHRRRWVGRPGLTLTFPATDFCRVRFYGGPDRSHLKYLAKRAGLIAAIRMEQKFKAMEDALHAK